MSNIEFKDLTFGYGDSLIFDHAQINIDDHWKLGLVGRNGRGKSTLLNLLQGKIITDSSVFTDKNFVYFPQLLTESDSNDENESDKSENQNFQNEYSRQNLSVKTTDRKSQLTFYLLNELAEFEQWKLERELSLLKVDLEVLWRPFESLSGGEQTKCLLAILFLDEANFPLIDEPTNHLDMESRKIVATYLKKKSGYIVVSHDRNFLDEVCDHILAIERQQIILYQGNYSTYEQEKKLRDVFELAEDEKLRKDISRLKKTSLEKRDWSNQRENVPGATFVDKKVAKKQNQRAKAIEKRMGQELENKEKLLKNIEKTEPLVMNYQASHHKRIIEFGKFSLAFDEKLLFQPVDFSLKVGEIAAFVGPNGQGKSSIIKYLAGNFSGQHSGVIQLPQGIKISLVRQIYDNRGYLKDFAVENQLDYELFLANLRKLGMERKQFTQKIETMSQGQQKKVELARSLSQEAELYLWDEPLNYLDVYNHEQIIQLLESNHPTMLLVEHDQSFVERVSNQIISLKDA
jgi:lincosamide and streptogramin A transport system ATP-binding/permease protein